MTYRCILARSEGGYFLARTYLFEECELDLGRYELRRSGKTVKLEKQPLDILILLLERPGELVTREEIRSRLWSEDVFLDADQGINNGIRKIRLALGDDSEEPQYIETVVGRGYRFKAKVTCVVGRGDAQPKGTGHAKLESAQLDVVRENAQQHLETEPPAPPVRSWSSYQSKVLWIFALVSLTVGILLTLSVGGWRGRMKGVSYASNAATGSPVTIRRSVAVLGFKNLSRRSESAWLSTALAEMLTTELAAGEQLRTVPGESVAYAKANLSLPDSDAYSRDTLLRLRQGLGTELVISGSYADLGSGSGGRLRVDFRVQDAVTGDTVASMAEVGTENELFQLVAHAGSDLRAKIGAAAVSAVDLASIQASYPATPTAARPYVEGLQKLVSYDAIGAKSLLEKAVAADPKYPLAHSELAMAWAALGYDVKAGDEAKNAFELSGMLSREERLLVEGRYRELSKQWPLAIDIYRTLSSFFPDNVEYGLRLAESQVSAGKPKEALLTLENLRRLPSPLGDDPRIDREESQAFNSTGDYKQELVSANTTARKAEAQGARLLVASARLGQCYSLMALGSIKDGRSQCETAKQTYASVGDHNAEAIATDFIAQSLYGEGDLSEAKRLDQEALTIFGATGNRRRMGMALTHLANIAWQEGDLDGALKGYTAALANYSAVGDTLNIAAAKDNLGSIHYLKGDLKLSQGLFQEALAGFRNVGSKGSVANALENLAACVSGQGDLKTAREMLDEAIDLDRKQGIKSEEAWGLAGLGDIDLAEGKLDDAVRDYNVALSVRTELGEKATIAESQVTLANLALERAQPSEAETRIRTAREEFRKEKQIDDEMLADIALARTFMAEAKYFEAHNEIQSARSFLAKTKTRSNQLQLEIVTAELEEALHRVNEAKQSLREVLAEAKQTGLVEYQYEARLELGKIQMRSGQTASGSADLIALQKDTASKGFLLLASKAAKELR